jgi:hypothetical protein
VGSVVVLTAEVTEATVVAVVAAVTSETTVLDAE